MNVLSGRGYAPTMLYFNCERGALADAAFRLALAQAIDQSEIIKTVTLDYADIGSPGFVSSDMQRCLTNPWR